MAEKKAVAVTKATPLPLEYGRLELFRPIKLEGGAESKEIIIFRPTCKAMMDILEAAGKGLQVQIAKFCDVCCKAVNGGEEPQPFNGRQLVVIDGADLASVITAMVEDADAVTLEPTGDGISEPYIYTLQHPIRMGSHEDADVIQQFEFEARTVGEIGEYLDARGERNEFSTFMRVFGKPLGVKIPIMSDALIEALDFVDYLVIRRRVISHFIVSRNRWKPAFSRGH